MQPWQPEPAALALPQRPDFKATRIHRNSPLSVWNGSQVKIDQVPFRSANSFRSANYW
jgi:hypothetical protein